MPFRKSIFYELFAIDSRPFRRAEKNFRPDDLLSETSKVITQMKIWISERDSLINFMMNLLSPIMKCEPFHSTFSADKGEKIIIIPAQPSRCSSADEQKVEQPRQESI
jgi:hypothetical protein